MIIQDTRMQKKSDACVELTAYDKFGNEIAKWLFPIPLGPPAISFTASLEYADKTCFSLSISAEGSCFVVHNYKLLSFSMNP